MIVDASLLEREIYGIIELHTSQSRLGAGRVYVNHNLHQLEKVVYELMTGVRSTLIDAIRVYTGLPVKSIEYHKGSMGLYIVVNVDSDASSVLERWLQVADKMRGLGLVILKWSSETNVTPVELGRYLNLIFSKMGMYLSMSSSFNVVESLREEWSE